MKWVLLLIFSICCGVIYSQTRPFQQDFDETEEEVLEIDIDSIDYESYTKKTSSFKALFNGKPGKAIMYGLLIPGGGQMYNRKYWKVPIALALEGGAITTFIIVRNRHIFLKNAYSLSLAGEANGTVLTTTQLNNFRKQYQKYTEQAGIAIIVVHFIVAVESYVNRHLIDFDISEDLSFGLKTPSFNSPLSAFGLSMNYNLSSSRKKIDPEKLAF